MLSEKVLYKLLDNTLMHSTNIHVYTYVHTHMYLHAYFHEYIISMYIHK